MSSCLQPLARAPLARRVRRLSVITSRLRPVSTQTPPPSSSSSSPPPSVLTPKGLKKEGDISSVFASLSGAAPEPLPSRYAAIKTSIVSQSPAAITTSFVRLLAHLKAEVESISTLGSDIVPSIDFQDINNHSRVLPFSAALKKRGVAVIRNVVPEAVATGWKHEIQEYVKKNPHTKAFPKDKPAVYELYWSPGQVKARANGNVLETQKFLMSFWHAEDKSALISTETPISYADRVRIRQPGDAQFALGPHMDGGSVERWEPAGYGAGKVYDDVFNSRWENFDPWESSGRIKAVSDMYNGTGGCSMFRMFQGWLAMSNTGPGEGTLLVNPLFKAATAYCLLRPFFSPINRDPNSRGFLDAENWKLDDPQTSDLQGAVPSLAQEFSAALHPHLQLDKTMVSVPRVNPGDYVAWHCDTIHAVDKTHRGHSDSSVLYIPACPLTEANASYLARQRQTFLDGLPAPDFPGGEGESRHLGRMTREDVFKAGGEEAERAMGLRPFKDTKEDVARVCNEILA